MTSAAMQLGYRSLSEMAVDLMIQELLEPSCRVAALEAWVEPIQADEEV